MFVTVTAGLILALAGTSLRTEAPASPVTESSSPSGQSAHPTKGTKPNDAGNAPPAAGTKATSSARTATAGQSATGTVHPLNHQPTVRFAREKIRGQTVISGDKEYPLRRYQTAALPDDPYASQWWTAAINLEQTWEIPRGSNPTVLAIIDTGFALSHEEFQDRWYANAGENGTTLAQNPSKYNCTDRGLAIDASCNLIDDDGDGVVDNETGTSNRQNPSQLNCTDQGLPLNKNCNMADDDSNGLVDDHRGWDFINWDRSTQAGEVNPAGTGTQHGSLVAGAAAATGNNGKGIAGVDWGTKILPLQALDDDSYGHTVSVGRAIRYAASQGADVISLSLGSVYHDEFVRNAIRDAIAAGVLVVAASGNDGCECILYPANYPEVIAVGALDTDSTPASFSSWGDNLDILAPGVSLRTTNWSASNPTSAYGYASGTSLATPVVSGMLTRMLSHQPAASPLQMIAALTENTNRLTLSGSTSRTKTLGFGSLDTYKTTQRLTAAYNPVQLYALSAISNGSQLTPDKPAEVNKPLRVYQCPPGKAGTTPVYDLSKQSLRLFTASPSERQRALELGYSSLLLAYSCIQLPQDQPLHIRSLNILSEFKNLSAKPL